MEMHVWCDVCVSFYVSQMKVTRRRASKVVINVQYSKHNITPSINSSQITTKFTENTLSGFPILLFVEEE
jgi:hypothetical protein